MSSMPLEKRLKQLMDAESSFVPTKSFRSRPINMAIVYPNTYSLGMSNLGFHSIYFQVNSREDALCHRAFLTYTSGDIKGTNDIKALESGQPISLYDIIGFSVSFEMDYINILKILDSSRIPLLAKDRFEGPLVMAGGPVVTFNPEPLTPFFDFFVIGEGEELIHEVLDSYKKLNGKSKQEILESLSELEGIYVPSLYDISYNDTGEVENFKTLRSVPSRINKRWIKNLDDYNTESVIMTPNTEFKDMFLLEVSRGCGRNCRFCMAGYCYRVPRARSLDKIMEKILFLLK